VQSLSETQIEAGEIALLVAEALDGVTHAFFTRKGGVSEGIYAGLNAGLGSDDDPDRVRENRRRISARLGVTPDRLLTMHQIHSADVVTVSEPFGSRPKADAMVTAAPGIALGVLTADCAPVLFADRAAGVVGAAHAGWRGAAGGVLEATVAAMEALGARAADTVAAVGPTIAQRSYEVGPEFKDAVLAASPDAGDLFRPSACAGRQMFDLPAYVCRRLAAAGVGTVADLALDTYTDEARFYSFRRAVHRGEADYGRLLAAVVLEP